MAVDSHPESNPSASEERDPFLSWVERSQRLLSTLLLVAGGILLIVATVYLVREINTGPEPESLTELTTTSRYANLAGSLGLLGLVLVGGGVLFRTRVRIDETPLSEARFKTLIIGGSLGLGLLLISLYWGYQFRSILSKWIQEGDSSNAWKILLAIFGMVLGIAITFVSVQLARAQERTNATLRRLIYGFNAMVSGFLLILILVVLNVLAFLELPGFLDTTSTGFFSLSDTSRTFLKRMNRTVQVYMILPDRQSQLNLYTNTRTLLSSVQEINPAHLKVAYLSPAVEDERIRDLQTKYPQAKQDGGLGILLVRADTDQAAFIPANDLLTRISSPDPEQTGDNFAYTGEVALMKKLSFLAEGLRKPVIYFLGGHDEIQCTATPQGPPDQAATRLYTYLNERNVEVKQLPFAVLGGPPKIPADADVLVIPRPVRPLTEAHVKAIEGYMFPAEGEGGKLFVLVDAYKAMQTGEAIAQTGLEPLLERLGVAIDTRLIYGISSRGVVRPMVSVKITEEAIRRDNPIALAYPPLPFLLLDLPIATQEISPQPSSAAQGLQPYSLLETGMLATIRLRNRPEDMAEMVRRLNESPQAQRDLEFTTEPIPIGVLVQESVPGAEGEPATDVPRAAVFGTASFITDANVRSVGDKATLGLFTATLDWLRDRPESIGIQPREYNIYSINSNDIDTFRLRGLPFFVMLFSIIGLGFGVWITRRR